MLDSFAKEITRRGFINKIGQGLVAANFADALLKESATAQHQEPRAEQDDRQMMGQSQRAGQRERRQIP